MSKKMSIIIISLLVFATLASFVFTMINEKKNSTENQGLSGVNPIIKEFKITAQQWSFDPPQIMVNRGDQVRFKVNSLDVNHGLAIDEYKINEQIIPGEEKQIEFVADKSGEFTFYCTVPCGQGHQLMKGELIVNN